MDPNAEHSGRAGSVQGFIEQINMNKDLQPGDEVAKKKKEKEKKQVSSPTKKQLKKKGTTKTPESGRVRIQGIHRQSNTGKMAGHKSKDIDKLGKSEGTRQTKNPRGRCNETQVKLIRKEQPIKPAGKHKSRK